MNVFEIVKYGVNCREAAERYGMEVNRYGMAICPFHNDRHPSLYLADDHYHCFACGARGDVIDFAGNLFGLPLYEAAERQAADFGINADRPPTQAILEKRRQKSEAQQLMGNERLCFSVLSEYTWLLRDWKVCYAPVSPEEEPDEQFVEACHELYHMEYLLDMLGSGDSYKRVEVVNHLLADGRLTDPLLLKEKSMPSWNAVPQRTFRAPFPTSWRS